MDTPGSVIDIINLTAGYRNGKKIEPVIRNLNAGLKKGEMVCLVGRNGIGKSTLLRTIAGIQPLLGGQIRINGKPFSSYSIPEMAKKISLVLTDRIFAGNLKVEELVSLGRHPYTNWLGTQTASDQEKILWAIDISNIREIRQRAIGELSDGQFQKVLIARALAQDGDIILLDEPTAHLDLPNKISILKLLKDLCDQTGKSILMATHELEFAIQMADKVWMLINEEEMIAGVPEDLILEGSFERLIDQDSVNFNLENGRFSINHEKKWFCQLDGDLPGSFWTANALHRLRWEVTKKETEVRITVYNRTGHYEWDITLPGKSHHLSTMEEVINTLKNLMKV